MLKLNDLKGKKFGKLTALHHYSSIVGKTKKSVVYWKCICECGNHTNVRASKLSSGYTKSCGCLKWPVSHNLAYSPLYHVWYNMLQRCNNPGHKSYNDYGKRGINVCEEWKSIENFHEWANASGYKKGLTLERLRNNEGYEPSNCKWATREEQSYNKRNTVLISFKGKLMNTKQISEIIGVSVSTIRARVIRNVTQEKLLKTIKKTT